MLVVVRGDLGGVDALGLTSDLGLVLFKLGNEAVIGMNLFDEKNRTILRLALTNRYASL